MPVVHDLDLRIGAAETVAVLGANGAGKSTLMKTLAHSLPSMAGRIVWKGVDATNWTASQTARAGIGYVPQDANVFRELTVNENLQVAADGRPSGQEETERLLLRFPILAARGKQQAGTLSGGERQMLALASALIMKPELLLLDEPTSGLAPRVVEDLVALIRETAESGVSVVWVVEQEPEMALAVADTAHIIAAGQIVATLTGDALTDKDYIASLVMAGPVASP